MDERELQAKQRQAILDGRRDDAEDLAHDAVRSGADLDACIEHGYVAGIEEVGRLWEQGEYFLPELMQGADAMKAAMAVLRPQLLTRAAGDAGDAGDAGSGPTVVIGTVQGDIHDIGKTLVATFLEANGFRVVDLGRDVPLTEFADAAVREEADLVCMSALLTTTMSGQGDVVAMLDERSVREQFQVLVGGAPVTRSYAESIGADGFAANAVDAVAEARRLVRTDS